MAEAAPPTTTAKQVKQAHKAQAAKAQPAPAGSKDSKAGDEAASPCPGSRTAAAPAAASTPQTMAAPATAATPPPAATPTGSAPRVACTPQAFGFSSTPPATQLSAGSNLDALDFLCDSDAESLSGLPQTAAQPVPATAGELLSKAETMDHWWKHVSSKPDPHSLVHV